MKSVNSTQIQIKICGVTKPKQALSCVEMGADLIGLNCWNGSSRYIIPEIIREITLQRGGQTQVPGQPDVVAVG